MSSKSLFTLTFLLVIALAAGFAWAADGDGDGQTRTQFTVLDVSIGNPGLTVPLTQIVANDVPAAATVPIGSRDDQTATTVGTVEGSNRQVVRVRVETSVALSRVQPQDVPFIEFDIYDEFTVGDRSPALITLGQLITDEGVGPNGGVLYVFEINVDNSVPLFQPFGDVDVGGERHVEIGGADDGLGANAIGNDGLDFYLRLVNNTDTGTPPDVTYEYVLAHDGATLRPPGPNGTGVDADDYFTYDSGEPQITAPATFTEIGTPGTLTPGGGAANTLWEPVDCADELQVDFNVIDFNSAAGSVEGPGLDGSGLDATTAEIYSSVDGGTTWTLYRSDAGGDLTSVAGAVVNGQTSLDFTFNIGALDFGTTALETVDFMFIIFDNAGNKYTSFPALQSTQDNNTILDLDSAAGTENQIDIDATNIPSLVVEARFPFDVAESALGADGPHNVGTPTTTVNIAADYPRFTLGDGTDDVAAVGAYQIAGTWDGAGMGAVPTFDPTGFTNDDHASEEVLYFLFYSSDGAAGIFQDGGGAPGAAVTAPLDVTSYFTQADAPGSSADINGTFTVIAVDNNDGDPEPEAILVQYVATGTENAGAFGWDDIEYDPNNNGTDAFYIGNCDYDAAFSQRVYFDQIGPDVTAADWEYGTPGDALANSTCTPADGPNPYGEAAYWEFGFNLNATGAQATDVSVDSEWLLGGFDTDGADEYPVSALVDASGTNLATGVAGGGDLANLVAGNVDFVTTGGDHTVFAIGIDEAAPTNPEDNAIFGWQAANSASDTWEGPVADLFGNSTNVNETITLDFNEVSAINNIFFLLDTPPTNGTDPATVAEAPGEVQVTTGQTVYIGIDVDAPVQDPSTTPILPNAGIGSDPLTANYFNLGTETWVQMDNEYDLNCRAIPNNEMHLYWTFEGFGDPNAATFTPVGTPATDNTYVWFSYTVQGPTVEEPGSYGVGAFLASPALCTAAYTDADAAPDTDTNGLSDVVEAGHDDNTQCLIDLDYGAPLGGTGLGEANDLTDLVENYVTIVFPPIIDADAGWNVRDLTTPGPECNEYEYTDGINDPEDHNIFANTATNPEHVLGALTLDQNSGEADQIGVAFEINGSGTYFPSGTAVHGALDNTDFIWYEIPNAPMFAGQTRNFIFDLNEAIFLDGVAGAPLVYAGDNATYGDQPAPISLTPDADMDDVLITSIRVAVRNSVIPVNPDVWSTPLDTDFSTGAAGTDGPEVEIFLDETDPVSAFNAFNTFATQSNTNLWWTNNVTEWEINYNATDPDDPGGPVDNASGVLSSFLDVTTPTPNTYTSTQSPSSGTFNYGTFEGDGQYDLSIYSADCAGNQEDPTATANAQASIFVDTTDPTCAELAMANMDIYEAGTTTALADPTLESHFDVGFAFTPIVEDGPNGVSPLGIGTGGWVELYVRQATPPNLTNYGPWNLNQTIDLQPYTATQDYDGGALNDVTFEVEISALPREARDGSGRYEFAIVYYDEAGNASPLPSSATGACATTTIDVDISGPTSAIVSDVPSCVTALSGDATVEFNVLVEYSDLDAGSGVTDLFVLANGPGGGPVQIGTTNFAADVGPAQVQVGVDLDNPLQWDPTNPGGGAAAAALTDGEYTIWSVALNAAGLLEGEASPTLTFTLDTAVPTPTAITITPATPTNNPQFVATATGITDNVGLTRVEWFVNGGLVETDPVSGTTADVSLTHEVTAGGTYDVYYVVYDECENSDQAATVTQEIDLDSPYAEITAIDNVAACPNPTADVNFTIADDAGYSAGYTTAEGTLYYRLEGGAWQTLGPAASPIQVTMNLGDGLYEFFVVAGDDDVGNSDETVVGTAAIEESYFLDCTAPTAEVVCAGLEDCYNSTTIQVPVTYDDTEPGSGVDFFEIYATTGAGNYELVATVQANGFGGVASVDLTNHSSGGADGVYGLYAVAYDHDGNFDFDATDLVGYPPQCDVTVDSTAPTATFDSFDSVNGVTTPGTNADHQTQDPVIDVIYDIDADNSDIDMWTFYYRYTEDVVNQPFGDWQEYTVNGVDFTPPAADQAFPFDIASASGVGYYEFALVMVDACGNTSTYVISDNIYIDADTPLSTIDLDNLANCYAPSAVVTVTGEAWNASGDITQVEVRVINLADETTAATATDAAPTSLGDGVWSFSADVTMPATDGEYGLISIATDEAGNTEIFNALTSDWVFFVDGTDPVITTVTVPATSDDHFVSVLYDGVTDVTSGVAMVEFYYSDDAGGTYTLYDIDILDLEGGESADGAFLFDASSVGGDNEYTWRLIATDACGNPVTVDEGPTEVDTYTPISSLTVGVVPACFGTLDVPVVLDIDDNEAVYSSEIVSVVFYGNDGSGWQVLTATPDPNTDGTLPATGVAAYGTALTVLNGGNWQFAAVATDDVGNQEVLSGDASAVVDLLPPTAALAPLPVYITNEDGLITLNYDVEDELDFGIEGNVTGIDVYYDTVPSTGPFLLGALSVFNPDGNGTIVIDADLDLNGDGEYEFYIEPYDCAFNFGASNTVSTIVDREAVVVDDDDAAYDCVDETTTDVVFNLVTDPVQTAELSGFAEIQVWSTVFDGTNWTTWEVFDVINGADLAALLVDDGTGHFYVEGTYTLTIADFTAELTDGNYRFAFVAVDEAGNIENTPVDFADFDAEFQVDRTAPEAILYDPGDYFTTVMVPIPYSATDAPYSSGLTVDLTFTALDGDDALAASPLNLNDPTIDGVYQLTGIDGEWQVDLTVTDGCDNEDTDGPETFIIDSATPVFGTASLPTDCDSTGFYSLDTVNDVVITQEAGGFFTIEVPVTDLNAGFTSGGEVRLGYQFNNGPTNWVPAATTAWTWAQGNANPATFTFQFNVDTHGDGDGNYLFVLRATDTAGNSTGDVLPTTVQWNVDREPPQATLDPLPSATTNPNIALSYDYGPTDESWERVQLWYSNDGGANWALYEEHMPQPQGSFEFFATFSSTYCFLTVAWDQCGNTNAPQAFIDAGLDVPTGTAAIAFGAADPYNDEDNEDVECIAVNNDLPSSIISDVTGSIVDIYCEDNTPFDCDDDGTNDVSVAVPFVADAAPGFHDEMKKVELWYRTYQDCDFNNDDFVYYTTMFRCTDATPDDGWDDNLDQACLVEIPNDGSYGYDQAAHPVLWTAPATFPNGDPLGGFDFCYPAGDGMYQFYTIAEDSAGLREIAPDGYVADWTIILDTNDDQPTAEVMINDTEFTVDDYVAAGDTRTIDYAVDFSDLVLGCDGSGVNEIWVFADWDCDFVGQFTPDETDNGYNQTLGITDPITNRTGLIAYYHSEDVTPDAAYVNAGIAFEAPELGTNGTLLGMLQTLQGLQGTIEGTFEAPADGDFRFYALSRDRTSCAANGMPGEPHFEGQPHFTDAGFMAEAMVTVDTEDPMSDISDNLIEPVEDDSMDYYYNDPILDIWYHAYNNFQEDCDQDGLTFDQDLGPNHPFGPYPRIERVEMWFRVDRCNDGSEDWRPWVHWTELGGDDVLSEGDVIDGNFVFNANNVSGPFGVDGVYQVFTRSFDHVNNIEGWPNGAASPSVVEPLNGDYLEDMRIAEFLIDTTPPEADAVCLNLPNVDYGYIFNTNIDTVYYDFSDWAPQGPPCMGSGVELVHMWVREIEIPGNDCTQTTDWVRVTDSSPDGMMEFEADVFSGDGLYEIEFQAVDFAGNVEPRTMEAECTILVDRHQPEAVSFTDGNGPFPQLRDWYNEDSTYPIVVRYMAEASSFSGVASVELYYSRDGGAWTLDTDNVHEFFGTTPSDNPNTVTECTVEDADVWHHSELVPNEQGEEDCLQQVWGTFCFYPPDGQDGLYEFALVATSLTDVVEDPMNTIDNFTQVDRVDPAITDIDFDTPTGDDETSFCNQFDINFMATDYSGNPVTGTPPAGVVGGLDHFILYFAFTPEVDNEVHYGAQANTYVQYPGMIYEADLASGTLDDGTFVFDVMDAMTATGVNLGTGDGVYEIYLTAYDGALDEISGDEDNHYRNLSVWSDVITVEVNNYPDTPTGLLSAADETTISLWWNPNTEDDIAGYHIYRGTEPGVTPNLVMDIDHNTLFNLWNGEVTFDVNNVYNGFGFSDDETYFFDVVAYDDNGPGSCGDDGDGDEPHYSPMGGNEVYAEMYDQQPLWVGWNMVSAPLEPVNDQQASVLEVGEVFEDYTDYLLIQEWDADGDFGWPGNYFNAINTAFTEGMGYYLFTYTEGAMIDWSSLLEAPYGAGSGATYSMDATHVMSLGHTNDPNVHDTVEGWNMLGNNLPVPIYWGAPAHDYQSITFSDDLYENKYYQWDGSMYEYYPGCPNCGIAQGTIDPTDAFWVHAANNNTVARIHRVNLGDLSGQVFNTTVALSRQDDTAETMTNGTRTVNTVDEMSWMMQLAANSADVRDHHNYIGIHNMAANGYDTAYDAQELMPLGDSKLMVYFPHDEVNLTTDVRNSIMDAEVWAMNVETHNVETPVTLTWPNISSMPLEYGVELVVLNDNGVPVETVDMRNNASYTFTPAATQASTDDNPLEGTSNLVKESPAVLPMTLRNDVGQVQRFEVHVYEITVSAELATFEAVSSSDELSLNWSTSYEDADHNGFHVYRALGNGSDMADFERISTELVVSENGFYTFADNNVEAQETYTYMLAAVDNDGREAEAGRLVVTFNPPKNVFALQGNYPNPFNPATTIAFSVPTTGKASLKIYNAAGQLVKTLVDGTVEAGSHKVLWDGRNDNDASTASGVYFYVLKAGEQTATNKMILLK